MSDDLLVRTATAADTDAVMTLLDEATKWLDWKGLDQWQHVQRRDEGVLRDIGEGTLFLVVDDGRPVGTLTVDELADAEFWHRWDRVRSALYVHRMAVARDCADRSIGSAMLDWAGLRALLSGRRKVRLDAWRTNHALHRYYRAQGFRQVRTVHPPPERPRGSGVLFERPAWVRRGVGPVLGPNWPAGDRSPRDPIPAPLASPHGRLDRSRLVPA